MELETPNHVYFLPFDSTKTWKIHRNHMRTFNNCKWLQKRSERYSQKWFVEMIRWLSQSSRLMHFKLNLSVSKMHSPFINNAIFFYTSFNEHYISKFENWKWILGNLSSILVLVHMLWKKVNNEYRANKWYEFER